MISQKFTFRLTSFVFVLAFISTTAFASTTDPSPDKKEKATTETEAIMASGITNFTLINANNNQPISGYNPIPNGAEIDIDALPTKNINIRANVGSDVSVGSVKFNLNGSSGGVDHKKTENAAPYALFGDKNGDYGSWGNTPNAGHKYSLTAEAFTGSKGSGTKINAKTISFSFVEAPASSGVVNFTLINANNDSPISGYNPIPNGAVIDLSKLPTNKLNIRANTNPSKVGSVVFDLNGSSGGSDFNRTEGAAPYALFGDSGGDYNNWKPSSPSAGNKFSLTATAYSGSKGSGTKLGAKTISFSFSGGSTSPPKDCAGVSGGSAFIDDCGDCVGGTTGEKACDTTPPPPPPSGGSGCGDFIEKGGIVAFEIESVPKRNNNWYKGNGPVNGLNVPKPVGSYYMYKANCKSDCEKIDKKSTADGNSMTYTVFINNPGTYRIQARTWQPNISYPGENAPTANNDFWIKLPDSGGIIKKTGGGTYNFGPNEWEKVFQNSTKGWRWETKVESPEGSSKLFVKFPKKGTYRIMISGRSKLFAMDRMVLYKGVSESKATSTPQSERKSCKTINDEDLLAIESPEIGLYPNPFSQTFNLNVNESVQSVRIYDLSGKVVYENNAVDTRSGQIEINLGTRPSGVYQVLMTTENGPKMIRVLKQ